MGQGQGRGALHRGGHAGGILALVRLDLDTDGALTADLVERAGVTLNSVPSTIGWGAALALVRHMTPDWATWRARHDELAPYVTSYGRVQLTVQAIDALADLAYVVECCHAKNHRTVKSPQHMRVPWRRDAGTRHFGSGAIPRASFYDWYYRRDGEAA